ncbi:PQ-loop-domain-containing protein [Backusella circina FSU 941]|nr:PQ-loop-domain-containing protein [Backusella circina FSU 941]
MDHNFASSLAGYLSIGCWLIVFTPQLWENYKRKNGDGLSFSFLVIWLAGDVFNLIGVIMQDLLVTMFILALYYTVADMVLIWQVIYYQRQNNKLPTEEEVFDSYTSNNDERNPLLDSATSTSYTEQRQQDTRQTSIQKQDRKNNTTVFNVMSWSLIILVTAISCYTYYLIHWCSHDTHQLSWFPQVMGWTSAILYVGSRIPQILKNWKNKSTEGLSFAMFICAVMGNVLFTSSIFLKSTNQSFIIMNLSWIVGSCGTLVFDFIIFIQFFIYSTPQPGKTVV